MIRLNDGVVLAIVLNSVKIDVFNDTVCRPSVVVPIFGPFVHFFFWLI